MSRRADAVRSMRNDRRAYKLWQACYRQTPASERHRDWRLDELDRACADAGERSFRAADGCVEKFGYFSHHCRSTRVVMCNPSFRVARFARWMRDHRRNPNCRGAK